MLAMAVPIKAALRRMRSRRPLSPAATARPRAPLLSLRTSAPASANISVASGPGSAVVVLFVYLIIVRALIMTLGEPDTITKRLSMYVGGFVGSLFCAFSATFWFEALEMSGQSNVKILPIIITFWLFAALFTVLLAAELMIMMKQIKLGPKEGGTK